METGEDWKKSVGFTINYSPGMSDDDFDQNDVVMRHPRQSDILLADGGDGSEADSLGTTPPRERIRNKNKYRYKMNFDTSSALVEGRRPKDDNAFFGNMAPERPRSNRLSLTIQRSRARDWKQDMGLREHKADSLPSPNPQPAVPTLVESCSRFMSLTSRLKCRANEGTREDEAGGEDAVELRTEGGELGARRVSFHKTFSLLINMGSVDKGCRRTISREEQVWQNELKDLIWLELQAKIAGRTLAEQDAFLCAQRNIVPAIVHNIRNYVFVSPNPCRNRTRRTGVIDGSTEDLRGDSGTENDVETSDFGCLSFNCHSCTEAIGKALLEVGTLLDSFYNAGALYPSSHGMCLDHPLIATQLFKHRLKAMCLWYNTALHLRLKILAVRRMIRSLKIKAKRRQYRHLASTESDVSRQSFESQRPCQVRFNVSNTPTDSSNSDSSALGDQKDTTDHGKPGQSDVGKSESGENSPGSNNPRQNTPGSNEAETIEEEQEISSHEEKTEKGDEVDGSCDSKKFEQNGPATPEIVIDSKYDTSDTVTSSESGYTSSLDDVTRQNEDVFDIGSLEDLVQLRLLNKCPVSIYRSYHYEILKTQGVRRCMQFMNKMRCNLLQKVHLTFEKPDDAKPESMTNAQGDPVEVFDDTKEEEHKTDDALDEEAKKAYELRRYGCWSEECLAMRLPSYRAHFLLLSSICMEAAHDYLSLRLEDRPQNPSCLTVKQLIHELKEGLDIATEMRAAYARNIEVALQGQAVGHTARNDLLLIIRTFDATVETVVKQYLSYLRTMSEVEQMGRSCLQTEWAFTARLARRVKCAALLAPVTFSEIAVNQLNRLHKQFEQKFDQVIELEKSTIDPDKHFLYALCRAVQHVYASEREAALQAAGWARALAARLARAPAPAYRTQRQDIFESLMRIRDLIVEQTQLILSRSHTPPAALDEASKDFTEAMGARIRELMLQIYRLGFELHKELYKFGQAPFELVQEKAQRRRPVSLQPTRLQPSEFGLRRRPRPETVFINESLNPMIHKELHRFVNPPSARRSVQASPPRRPRFNRQESAADDNETNIFDDKLFENINTYGENQTSIELLLTGELPRLEEPVDLRHSSAAPHVSEQERQWATRVARAVVEFAKCWMMFVIERCDTGRGLRPRWASQGLEFLMLACDPCNTKHLTEEEFEDLKKKMDLCISHVIGSRPAPRAAESCAHTNEHRRRPRLHSPLPTTREVTDAGRSVPAPPTPPIAPEPLLNFPGLDTSAHSTRVLSAVEELERSRDQQLREKKAVGNVVAGSVTSYEPKLRQLKFKWQRGLKIGAGTFGKVYTVVNTESGQLLAMKELSIGAGDRRALQRAANELKVLEGVIHPHLVRYYGCELHREEMLIFMELCVEGSLEALIATSGALAEHTTRRYTRQLLSAVSELHARAIAHRDIKSGNIFLTNEGHCLKLGDFGCAVKIRANTTAAGELIGHVGTQAYMAPEVFMKSTGHGRAADIWSLGCVVTEMASGKRPFSEYDSNVQIMFVVGMGGRPAVPDSLSLEGQEFCRACLTHEPETRPRAEALQLHHFLKIKADDEDCNCEPAYLITPPRPKNQNIYAS